MSQNNALHQACEAWLRDVLTFLQSKTESINDSESVSQGNDWQQAALNHDYFMLYIYSLNEITHFPAFNTMVDIIRRTPKLLSSLCVDRIGKPILDPNMQIRQLHMYFLTFFTEYNNMTRECIFKKAEFEQIYEKLEEFIYSSEPLKGLWLVSFRNLTSELSTVILESGIFFRQVTEEEKTQAARNILILPDIQNVILEIHHTFERTSIVQQQVGVDIAEAVVLALRLIKGGSVGIDKFQWSVLDQPFWSDAEQSSTKSLLPSTYYGEPYVLTQEDATTLQALWPKAKKAYTDPKLSTAINRLEDAYSRTKDEDRLIDYWTALEALFLPFDEYVREMGDMVAVAVSFYIGQIDTERNSIREDIRRSHALRSYFVHGKRGKQKSDLNEMVQKTGQHLRRALRQMIEE